MTDTRAFHSAIKRNHKTFQGIAHMMGISRISLLFKSRNVTEFYVREIELFCQICGVTTKSEMEQIFFAE